MRAVPKVGVAEALARVTARRPVSVLLVAVLVAALAVWITATRLQFETGHRDLVSSDERFRQLDAQYDREFAELPERVVVVVQSPDPETAKAFATALGQRWEGDPAIEKALYRISPGALKTKGLFYLSRDELAALAAQLETRRGLMRDLSGSPTLVTLLGLINRELTTTLVDYLFTRDLDEDRTDDEPLDVTPLLALLREMTRSLGGAATYRSPWEAMFSVGGSASQDGFLWSDDRRLLFVVANPKASGGEFNRFQAAIDRMRADVQDLRRGFPDVDVGLTGRGVMETDEMAAAKRDMALASVIAFGGVTLLFVIAFRGVVRPVLAAIPPLIGLAWTMGFATVTVGHLNILTIALLPMLIGLGDYSVHVIARYDEERAAGHPVAAALARTFAGTGSGILAAALTTALSFSTLLLAGFKGLGELGFLSGSGIVLSALAALIVLPALLQLTEPALRARGSGSPGLSAEYLPWLRRHPRLALAASGVLVAVSLVGLGGVRADFNLLHLQAEGTEAATWIQRIFESADRSVLFEEVTAHSLDEVRRKAAALEALPSVARVESIASVLPEDQDAKRPLVRRVASLAAGRSLDRVGPEPVDLDALRAVLGRIKAKMATDDTASGDAQDRTRDEDRQAVRRLIEEFLAVAGRRDPAEVRSALAAFQAELFRDLGDTLAMLTGNPEAEPVTLADVPPALRERYVGKTGHYRLFVHPVEDVWDFEPLARFVRDVTSVDSDAHGTPASLFAYLRTMKEGYVRAGLYALVGVAILAFLTFRALGPTLLALVPVAVGSVWTLGGMGFLGVPFNVANLLVVPLVVGIGIDSGIYVVHRFREASGAPDGPVLPRSTGHAIMLSGLTTLVGFGTLMISSHRGLASLGLVVVLGVSSVLVTSVVTLPSLLAVLARTAPAAPAPEPPAALVPSAVSRGRGLAESLAEGARVSAVATRMPANEAAGMRS